jgi:hypothetical protein
VPTTCLGGRRLPHVFSAKLGIDQEASRRSVQALAPLAAAAPFSEGVDLSAPDSPFDSRAPDSRVFAYLEPVGGHRKFGSLYRAIRRSLWLGGAACNEVALAPLSGSPIRAFTESRSTRAVVTRHCGGSDRDNSTALLGR